MPFYMDLHKGLKGLTMKDAEYAHLLDVKIQDQFGVKIHKFSMNEESGTVFCPVEAPNEEACRAVNLNADGNVGCEIIEVQPTYVALILGEGKTSPIGRAIHQDCKIDSAIRNFMFTDIVFSTDLMLKYGDTTAISILRAHNKIVRSCLQKDHGNEVKHTGDGIMASFISSSKAVRCAPEIQSRLKDYREENPEIPLHVRIGMHAGKPVTEGNDFFGAAVQLAKRICDFAKPDTVLVSAIIKDLCMGKNIPFRTMGEQKFKGSAEPYAVYRVDL